MKKNYKTISIMFFLLMSFLMLSAGESKQETLKFERIKELEVSNITGRINITGWDKDFVEVTYTKKAQYEDDLEDIDVDIDQRGDALHIVTDLPWRCKKCEVDYDIFVPEKFNLIEAKTVTGSVDVQKIHFVDEITTHSTTGSINAEISARIIEANVVTGSIKLYIQDIPKDGEITAEAVTGGIKIYAPADLSADVDASAVTGGVDIDYEFNKVRVKKRSKIRGTIGNGDVMCNLSTVTGSIYLGTK
ncbi:MAG: DUF4097 family beta strand repeat protein [Calditrichaceae bacterium]|nr:DUF4097 family beta strand repeat protein [Calditrichaceae bacterium]HES59461.1 hypothetical protein [Caldithrix sp.]